MCLPASQAACMYSEMTHPILAECPQMYEALTKHAVTETGSLIPGNRSVVFGFIT